jgi:DNA-binding LacI/PurR family transcriptional regulator
MLNYQPNAIARSLSQKASRMVGIIATDLDNPFYAQLLAHMSIELQASGYAILLMVSRSSDIDEYLSRLLSYQVDGVIVTAATLSSSMAVSLQRSGRPVVLVNNYLRDGGVNAVSSDNYPGGRLVADLLVEAGRKRIAFIAGEANTSSGLDRGLGLRDRLAEQGMTIYAQESGEYRHAEAAMAARKLLSLSPPPDAIFCANDVMAIAALMVARNEFGLRVPADLSIVGFDDSDEATREIYQLTTVDQHLDIMASKTVALMLNAIAEGTRSIQHLIVPVSLVRRATH